MCSLLKKVKGKLIQKKNPRMYPKIIGYEENQHFVIKGVDFGYKIDDKTIIIADCRFVKSSIKLKLR